MKKILLLMLTVLLLICSLTGCKEPRVTDDMDIMYVYVEASGSDWIYGNDTLIYCGKNHGYNQFCTVKVEYYKSDLVQEPGSLNSDCPYSQVLKKVVYSRLADGSKNEPIFDKPVIYLYPQQTMDVFVKLDFVGRFTQTIPSYGNGWHVTASPDGTLLADDGKTYPYLFWEGVPSRTFDITEGFCVKGNETREFLETVLPEMGLTEKEYNEFIEYWLPQMECNKYNLIQFYGDEYCDIAKLNIAPAPDSILRVFMAYRAVDEYTELTPQTFKPFSREGFTVVEWGGTCLD